MFLEEYTYENALEAEREAARMEGYEEGREERDQYFLELLDQGLSIDEIKQRLTGH